MARYLLVESRDPFATEDVRHFYDVPARLARAFNRVTLYLTDDGVLAARAGRHTFWIAALTSAGVEILADARSLHERGIAPEGCRRACGPQRRATLCLACKTSIFHSGYEQHHRGGAGSATALGLRIRRALMERIRARARSAPPAPRCSARTARSW